MIKTSAKALFVFLFTLSFIFQSCSKYGYVSLNYTTPPQLLIPERIKTIAVFNRTHLPKEEKKQNIIEGIISGEMPGSDRLASDECVRGFYESAQNLQGLKIIMGGERLYGNAGRQTPDALDWKTIQDLCNSNHTDAVLMLETFDSNTDMVVDAILNGINLIQGGTPVTRNIKMTVYYVWRLYDPLDKRIIDQFEDNYNMAFPPGSVAGLPPLNALPQTAYAAGEEYASRFFSGSYSVNRTFYKKGKASGKHDFKTAFRESQLANWEAAATLWTKQSNSENRKNAGRACFNMAVACETLGKYDLAVTWAEKAYSEYGIQMALPYANELKQRPIHKL